MNVGATQTLASGLLDNVARLDADGATIPSSAISEPKIDQAAFVLASPMIAIDQYETRIRITGCQMVDD